MIIIFFLINICFSLIHQFDEDNAFALLEKQCEFGPRYPGSIGHEEFSEYLINYFSKLNCTIEIFTDSIYHPNQKDLKIQIKNILVHHNPEINNRLLFMAHWDTRDRAEKDEDINNRSKPIIGANDGASGVALLMELSDYISNYPLKNIGIDFLFVDAEDMGRKNHTYEWGLGTQSFTKSYDGIMPKYAICIDMIADKNPIFKIERFSYQFAKELVQEIWTFANNLGYKEFVWQLGPAIYDDHFFFYEGTKVPSINIIDFDYEHWHTTQDIPENCSSKGLGIVGNVMLNFIYEIDKNE